MASITQTGPSSWRAQVRVQGTKPIAKTHRTEALAKKWADRVERELREGRDPLAPEANAKLTLSAVIDEFERVRARSKRPVRVGSTEHYMLKHLRDGLGSRAIGALTPAVILKWAQDRAEADAGPATVGMELSKLGTVVRHAAASLGVALVDPTPAARTLCEYNGVSGPSNHRDRRPTPDEWSRLIREAEPQLAQIILAAVATCMRRGEITRVLWADFDRERRLLTIRDRKHPRKTAGNHHTLPLLGNAYSLLESQPKVDRRIFPVAPEWISDTFKALCDRLGIVDLHFHDLRAEGVCRLFEAGYTIEQVALVSGHKKWDHLKRYARLRPETLATRPPPVAPVEPAPVVVAPAPAPLASGAGWTDC